MTHATWVSVSGTGTVGCCPGQPRRVTGSDVSSLPYSRLALVAELAKPRCPADSPHCSMLIIDHKQRNVSFPAPEAAGTHTRARWRAHEHTSGEPETHVHISYACLPLCPVPHPPPAPSPQWRPRAQCIAHRETPSRSRPWPVRRRCCAAHAVMQRSGSPSLRRSAMHRKKPVHSPCTRRRMPGSLHERCRRASAARPAAASPRADAAGRSSRPSLQRCLALCSHQ